MTVHKSMLCQIILIVNMNIMDILASNKSNACLRHRANKWEFEQLRVNETSHGLRWLEPSPTFEVTTYYSVKCCWIHTRYIRLIS